jgi:porin
MVYWFAIFAMMILFPAIAEAQVEAGRTALSLLIPLEPPEALPASGTQGGYLFNLRPLGADFGKTLADHGVYLVARDLSEILGNVSGGLKRGGSFEGYTAVGFDLDMERIAGIPGGSVHFLLDDLQGQSFAGYSGSSYLNNRVFAGNGPAFRLNELSYEQSLFNKRVDVRVGRVPAYTQFDGSEIYCTFITSLCRTPAAYTFDRGYPPYVASSWAAVAQIRIAGPFYTNIGIYENEPILATTNHGGFLGPDWGFNYAAGATIPVQYGYRTTLQNDRYPRDFSVGGFYNTGRYPDPLLNSDGRNRTLFGGASKMDVGASQFYVQAQQMVYRPDATDRGLTLFGGANWATSGEPNVERMLFAGAYYKGPFAQRLNDTTGVAVSLVDVNPRITERINSILSRSSGGQASRSEISYQVNYGFAIAPGMMIKPFFEFISHPEQAAASTPSGNDTHAIFVGALFEVDVAHLLGLPTLGG